MNCRIPFTQNTEKQFLEKTFLPSKLVASDTEEEWVPLAGLSNHHDQHQAWVEGGKKEKESTHWQGIGREVQKESGMLSVLQKFSEKHVSHTRKVTCLIPIKRPLGFLPPYFPF